LEPVRPGKSRIPIRPLHELVPEPCPPALRPRDDVGDRPKTWFRTDHECERIVEPQRRGPDEAGGLVGLPHALQHLRRRPTRRLLQDRRERRPRVLHVHVDLPRADRRVAHERAAQVEAPLDGDAERLDRLGKEPAQDPLLREVFRADYDPVAPTSAADEEQQRNEDPHRGGRSQRSTAPSPTSAPIARSAAGSAPMRIVRLSTIATPRKMKTPRPPAPIAAAMVVTPMPTTVATRIPARITFAASGRSPCINSCRSVIPIPRPASRTAGSTPAMPVTVFRSTGSNAYRVNATSAVRVPMPPIIGTGMRKPKRARLGMVCT